MRDHNNDFSISAHWRLGGDIPAKDHYEIILEIQTVSFDASTQTIIEQYYFTHNKCRFKHN